MKDSDWSAVLALALFLLVGIAFVIVGRMDESDARRQQDHYCKMVHDGYWPDYKHTYWVACKGERGR